jgi:hypothetical protein
MQQKRRRRARGEEVKHNKRKANTTWVALKESNMGGCDFK